MTEPVRQDDASVPDSAPLWRRIPPWHFVFEENANAWRPSSAAFDNDPDGGPMSVVLGDEVIGAGRLPVDVLAGHQGYALAAITVEVARRAGQGVVRDPVPAEPAHALVYGPKPRSVQRQLARAAVWVIPPVPPG